MAGACVPVPRAWLLVDQLGAGVAHLTQAGAEHISTVTGSQEALRLAGGQAARRARAPRARRDAARGPGGPGAPWPPAWRGACGRARCPAHAAARLLRCAAVANGAVCRGCQAVCGERGGLTAPAAGPRRRGARRSCAPRWRRPPPRRRGCRRRCWRGASCAAWAPRRRPRRQPPLCGGASCPGCRRARARCSWPRTSGPPTSWATRRAPSKPWRTLAHPGAPWRASAAANPGAPWRTLAHPGAPAPPPAAGAPGVGSPGVPWRRCGLGAAVALAPGVLAGRRAALNLLVGGVARIPAPPRTRALLSVLPPTRQPARACMRTARFFFLYGFACRARPALEG